MITAEKEVKPLHCKGLKRKIKNQTLKTGQEEGTGKVLRGLAKCNK